MSESGSTPNALVLTAREAAERLRVSERTLWSLTKAGEIPVKRIGRRVLYPVAALVAWVEGKGGPRVEPG